MNKSPLKSFGRSTRSERSKYVMYVAVLPDYRREFVTALRRLLPNDLVMITSAAHHNRSIKTGISPELYRRVPMVRLGRYFFLQAGGFTSAIAADATVVDLNPRSLSAWAILLTRRAVGKRTVLWGHLHSRGGSNSPTAAIRRKMRLLGDGFISYTITNATEALTEAPQQGVWVATNALYSQKQLIERMTDKGSTPGQRTDFLYVGRFEPPKKVDVAVRAFALLAQENAEYRLVLIGDGSERKNLQRLVEAQGLDGRVVFGGWQSSFDQIAAAYSTAIAGLSPGFAGLGVTQSLGFGVPIIVSTHEPHSPEIELKESGGVHWFATDDEADLAHKMRELAEQRFSLPSTALIRHVFERYTAESMAAGVKAALENNRTYAVSSGAMIEEDTNE